MGNSHSNDSNESDDKQKTKTKTKKGLFKRRISKVNKPDVQETEPNVYTGPEDIRGAPAPPPLKAKPRQPENFVKIIFTAIYDYESRETDEISFQKDDEIVSLEDVADKEWFLGQNERTKEVGLVPKVYLRQKDSNEFETLAGYFPINRIEAEKMLQAMNIPVGSYIVRPSTEETSLAVSVRSLESSEVDRYCVKHFKIKKKGEKYTLDGNHEFNLVQELIDFHKKDDEHTNIKLTNPAPKEPPDVPFKLFEVERTNFIMYDELGHGNFGSVQKAKWGAKSKNFVAIKVVKPGKMTIGEFLGEAEIMHKMKHTNIVKLLAISTKPEHEPIYIVTEFMANGDLLNYLRKTEVKPIEFSKMIKMMFQIADGMAYLERKNYIHRDLRAANVLVDENVTVKVADFGLSALTNEETQETAIKQGAKFPVKWTAPEIMTSRLASIKSDVWSFGVLIFEIVTYGAVPYSGHNNSETYDLVVNKNYRMPNPDKMSCSYNRICHCPKELYENMLDCWKGYPNDRPTFEWIKAHLGDWAVELDDRDLK